MTMAKKSEEYGFLVCEDGIYYGRALKNGSISKDSRKVEKSEIVEMFSEILQDYCLRTGQPMVVERKNGTPLFEARLIV